MSSTPVDDKQPRGDDPKIDGFFDYDDSSNDLVVINQKTTDFAVQLLDSGGIGIDDSTILLDLTDSTSVDPNVVTVYRAPSMEVFGVLPESQWPVLRLNDDYLLEWDSANNILHVLPATGVWESGSYYVIDVNNTLVRDLAANTLQANRNPAPFTGKTLFTIQLTGLDFGDLPDDPDDLATPDYVTLLNSGPVNGQGGARHVVTGGVFLGSEPGVELDANTGPAVPASPNDELYQERNDFQHTANGDLHDDGVVVTSALLMGGVAEITVNASTDGFLNAWIDFNGDGTIDRSDERIFPNEPLTAGINTLTFNVPADSVVNPDDPSTAIYEPTVADVYQRGARFRFTTESFDEGAYPWLAGGLTDPEKGFTGIAYDGEVEDYMFDVVRYRQDWGDAPSDPILGNHLFPTLDQLEGATHFITGPYLGTVPDAEMNGQPTLNASGDDLDNDGSGPILAATGTGEVDTAVTYTTSGGWSGAPATIAAFNPAGINNAFQIIEPTGTNGIEVVFATGTPDATWSNLNQQLTVTFEDGITTAGDLVDLINNAIGSPLVADLVDDLHNDDEDGITFLGVDLDPSTTLVPGNDESRIEINLGGANSAKLEGWIDFDGDGVWADDRARTDWINPEGMHDEFRFIATDPGQVGTRIGVIFHSGNGLALAYDVNTRVLDITYEPGTTTLGDLAAAVNTGSLPAEQFPDGYPDGYEVSTSNGADGVKASATITAPGYKNDFFVEADEDKTASNFTILFTHSTDSDPNVTWTTDSRTLEIEFQPYVTSAQSIVHAINDAGVPLHAETVKEAFDQTVTSPAASGTGTLSGFDLLTQFPLTTDNATTTTPATTGVVELSGYDNDFVVTAQNNDQDFEIQFVQTADPEPQVQWTPGVTNILRIEVQRGVTTAADLVQKINDSAAEVNATLVGDLPMKVELFASEDNSGEGTIALGDINLAVTYVTSGGDAVTQSTIGVIDPVGENNAFEIKAADPGADKDGILVTFYESDTAGARWNNDTETLTVRYVPGIGATTANELVGLINGIADSTFPLVADIVDPEPNDGSAIVSDTDLVDELAAMTAGAVADTDYATTGLIGLADNNNNEFEIVATDPGPDQNGIGIVFVHNSGNGIRQLESFGRLERRSHGYL